MLDNKKTLEQEAQEFKSKRRPRGKPRPMSSRIYLMGQAMSGILARSRGLISKEDLKQEAEDLADFFLED